MAVVSKTFRAMGCEVAVVGEGTRLDAFDALPAWFEAREGTLSRFRPDSALSRLNTQRALACAAEPVLWHALDVALKAAEWTGGLVTPTIGEALLRAGYDRDFAALSDSGPAPAAPAHPAAPAPDWRLVERDFGSRTVRLSPGVTLDLGGTVKGAVADELVRQLGEGAPVLVDLGGDIAVRGPRLNGEPWPVSVANPRGGAPLCTLALERGGVATSGRDFRRWKGGHHLIDPHAGAPSASPVLSATVIAHAALTAEVAAKVVLLLGARLGLDWLERRGLAGVAVLENGAVEKTAAFDDFVWS